jgi:hypothetical protein
LESPCEFCRSRRILEPCVKLWGPKKQASSSQPSVPIHKAHDAEPAASRQTDAVLQPSAAITVYDPTIDQNDVKLLQHAFSDEYVYRRHYPGVALYTLPAQFIYVGLLLRTIGSVYGLSIQHVGLRHAILAFVGAGTKILCDSDHIQHASEACRRLRKKLDRPDAVDEGDFFLACLLALWSVSHCKEKNVAKDTFRRHLQGCFAIMKHLSDRARGRVQSYRLAAFWPLARDILYCYGVKHVWQLGDEEHESVCQEFRQVMGPELYQQPVTYQLGLGKSESSKSFIPFILAALRQYQHLKCHFQKVAMGNSCEVDSTVVALLADVRNDRSVIDEGEMLAQSERDLDRLQGLDEAVVVDADSLLLTIRSRAMMLLLLPIIDLLCIILEESALAQGFCSPRGIFRATTIAMRIRRIGGALFLMPDKFQHELVRGQLDYRGLRLWSRLVPRAGRRYLDSKYTFLFISKCIVSPWVIFDKVLDPEDFGVRLMNSWTRVDSQANFPSYPSLDDLSPQKLFDAVLFTRFTMAEMLEPA